MKKVQCMQSTQIFLRITSIITRKRQAYTITYVYVIQRIKETNINKSTIKNHTIADNYLEYDFS